MFKRLARLVVHHPWRVIAVWIVAAAVIVATAPALPTSTEQSDFLPRHYESIICAAFAASAGSMPAI